MYFDHKNVAGILLSLAAAVGSHATFANQPTMPDGKSGSMSDRILSSLVVTISGGPVWESAGHTQTFYLQPNIEKTYAATNQTHALADGELFVGVQRVLNDRFQGQFGLAVATTSNAGLSGHIWDDANAAFNNFTYGYQVQHTHVAVKGKVLTDTTFYALKPYVSGSLGVGFNRAHNFTSMPTLFEAIPAPDFTSNSSTVFTYTVGLGVQRALNDHWQAGIGYEFADWGGSQLGQAPGQTMGNGLSLNHLYTNGLLLNLSWLA